MHAVTAVRATRALDVHTGRYIPHPVVYVQDGRILHIESLAPSVALSNHDADVLYQLGDDSTLLPGLIDAHVHLMWGVPGDQRDEMLVARENAARTLLAGFTTVRDLGASPGEASLQLALRDEIARGDSVGPRVIACGEPWRPEDLRAANSAALLDDGTHARIADGADCIKVFDFPRDARDTPSFSADNVRAISDSAHRFNCCVAVHAHDTQAIMAAARGGADSVEHGWEIDSEATRAMLAHGTTLVPTLYLPNLYLASRHDYDFPDTEWRFFTANARGRNAEHIAPAVRAGVPIVFGTDAVGAFHGANALEFPMLLRAGLSPLEALRSATTRAASLLRVPTGALHQGLAADMIGTSGDVLASVEPLQRVEFVMRDGTYYAR